ncbi:hypothetical protein D3C77_338130 [compost metagenome]
MYSFVSFIAAQQLELGSVQRHLDGATPCAHPRRASAGDLDRCVAPNEYFRDPDRCALARWCMALGWPRGLVL